MQLSRQAEIYNNFQFFQEVVGGLMPQYAGKYALIRSQEVVDYFGTPGEAVVEGARRFGEQPFSIQHVITKPIDLGFLSHAADNGVAVSR